MRHCLQATRSLCFLLANLVSGNLRGRAVSVRCFQKKPQAREGASERWAGAGREQGEGALEAPAHGDLGFRGGRSTAAQRCDLGPLASLCPRDCRT